MSVTVTTINVAGGSGPHRACRPVFYANGRFWIVYYHNGNLVFRSSTDGASWSSGTIIRSTTSGWAIHFDGTYMHYVAGIYSDKANVFYRRGAPQSNGTMTWSAAEQTVFNHGTGHSRYFNINVDTDGYAYIVWSWVYNSNVGDCSVYKSGNNDGTWGTNETYGISSSGYSWGGELVQLSGGEMYVVYHKSSTLGLYGRLWNGTSWESESTATTNLYSPGQFSAVADSDDNVHVSYMAPSATYHIHYKKWTYGGSWGSEETIKGGTNTYHGYEAGNLSIDPDTDHIYHIRCTDSPDFIYYAKRITSWGAQTYWINESTDTLDPTDSRINAFPRAMNGGIGISYQTTAANPWNLKFAFLQFGWGHKINGVEPANIIGISVVDINKVNGIE